MTIEAKVKIDKASERMPPTQRQIRQRLTNTQNVRDENTQKYNGTHPTRQKQKQRHTRDVQNTRYIQNLPRKYTKHSKATGQTTQTLGGSLTSSPTKTRNS